MVTVACGLAAWGRPCGCRVNRPATEGVSAFGARVGWGRGPRKLSVDGLVDPPLLLVRWACAPRSPDVLGSTNSEAPHAKLRRAVKRELRREMGRVFFRASTHGDDRSNVRAAQPPEIPQLAPAAYA